MVLPMRLKSIGKTIMRKVNLNLKRKEILEISKKYIVKDGWNEYLFESISKKSKFNINEIKILFSEGYLSLLMKKEKNFYKKIFLSLLLPKKQISVPAQLYTSIDQIWFIAGDKSVDFNFYSKRFILAAIYSSVVQYWIKNQDIRKTTIFLDKQLRKVSKITQTKNNFKNTFNFLPQIFNVVKSFRPTKQ